MSAIYEQMNASIEAATVRWKRGFLSVEDLKQAIDAAQYRALERYEQEMEGCDDATAHPLWNEYEGVLYTVAENFADELGVA